MPAVLLSRLEQQIQAFSPTFDRPDTFVPNVIGLLELYADRTYQAGYEVPPSSKMVAYRVPGVVMHSLELEFHRLAKTAPDNALLIADQLWSGHRLELKQLAISLLGSIPLENADQVMERIGKWAPGCSDRILLRELLTKSNPLILQERPLLWIQKSREWLHSRDSSLIILGIKSLEPFLETENFNDLPQVYDSIHPLLNTMKVDVYPEMFQLVDQLVERHPTETVAFLKQIILENPVTSTLRLIRKILPSLPNPAQISIRETMERANPSPLDSRLPPVKTKGLKRKVKKSRIR